MTTETEPRTEREWVKWRMRNDAAYPIQSDVEAERILRRIETEASRLERERLAERVGELPEPYEGRDDLTIGEVNVKAGIMAGRSEVLALLSTEGSGK